MANRLFTRSANKLGTFGRGLRVLQDSVRECSNKSWRSGTTQAEQIIFNSNLDKQGEIIWPDPHLGCLGPKDQRLGFPGNVGLDDALEPPKKEPLPSKSQLEANQNRTRQFFNSSITLWRNLGETPTSYNRQIEILKQHGEIERIEMEEQEEIEKNLAKSRLSDDLECVAVPCPDLLRKELAGLFGTLNMMDGPFTVITFAQKTKNDMSAWSQEVEDEREVLMEVFVNAARDLCADLRKKGVWSDFIDPNSGRPYFGPYTNMTFFETNEQYRHLGFQIIDLGCCKVISHHKFGTHTFVGSLFTTAPHDCEFIVESLTKINENLKTY